MEIGARSTPIYQKMPVETTTLLLPQCGLGEYDSKTVGKAIRRWRNNVDNEKTLSYGELAFQSKIMHDGLSDRRLRSIYTGFIAIKLISASCTGNLLEVKYSLMQSCSEICAAKGKYHLVPRIKKYKDYFELITFDVELD